MMYWREITVNWGESDPFGLVYYPRMLAWFNDTEHELFRTLGYPIDKMIQNDRTTFVMGEIQFRFIGPAAYGDRVTLKLELTEIREHPPVALHRETHADRRARHRRHCDSSLRPHQRRRDAQIAENP